MRFKEFLAEQNAAEASNRVSTVEVDGDYARQFFKNNPHALRNVKEGFNLWRGMGDEADFILYGDSRTFTRKSANTENFYTLFISSMKTWKDFPSRQHAYICTTSAHSLGYGIKYAVIPADDAKIGYCRAKDFWWSFKKGLTFVGSLMGLNAVLKRAWHMVEETENLNETDAQILRKQLRSLTLEKLLSFSSWNEKVEELISFMKEIKADNVEEALEHGMDPIRNSFAWGLGKDISDYLDNAFESREAWVEGRCLFIRADGKSILQERLQIILDGKELHPEDVLGVDGSDYSQEVPGYSQDTSNPQYQQ
jgi:hypothetical protein